MLQTQVKLQPIDLHQGLRLDEGRQSGSASGGRPNAAAAAASIAHSEAALVTRCGLSLNSRLAGAVGFRPLSPAAPPPLSHLMR